MHRPTDRLDRKRPGFVMADRGTLAVLNRGYGFALLWLERFRNVTRD